jgi:CBS domain containing-hemolysin-like protein
MYWITIFLFFAILILLNGLYVAAEFSTVSSRKSRLSQLADSGNTSALAILRIVEHPETLDAYVATCQVGITISSLVLGFYGQSLLGEALVPFLGQISALSIIAAQSISTTIVLIGLTIVQVLIGELVPKNIGIQYPEQLSMLTNLPMSWSSWLFRPLIWVLNGSGILIMRLFGLEAHAEHSHIHAPEEISMLAAESQAGGILKAEEHRLLRNTLQMRESNVRQVMIPRPRMLSASDETRPAELLQMLAESPFSRMPIYKGSIDNVIGVVHLRDLLCAATNGSEQSVAELIHSVPFVPESMAVRDVFSLLQNKQFQVAVVLDEFGGTAGMVTLEDLLEQIFGNLEDEFDMPRPVFQLGPSGRIWIRGEAQIADVNEILGFDLPNENVETIGGLLLNAIGHVPVLRETLTINDAEFRIEEMTGRGIGLVSLVGTTEQYDRVMESLQ